MPTHLDLLDLCLRCYDSADLTAGPLGRDGAHVEHYADGSAALCFRGTLTTGLVSIFDWLNDFHGELAEADGINGKVHAGFRASLDLLWPGVLESLKGVSRLTITGHSKGGALALLAGARLKELQPAVVTFAAPMAGNASFVGTYPVLSVVRYEASEDLVPMLPLLGYSGTGEVRTNNSQMMAWRKYKVELLIAEGRWQEIHRNHSLETGYRPWVASWPGPRAGAA